MIVSDVETRLGSAYTIDTWMRWTNAVSPCTFMGCSPSHAFLFAYNSSTFQFHNSATFSDSTTALATGVWNHVAYTRAGTTNRFIIRDWFKLWHANEPDFGARRLERRLCRSTGRDAAFDGGPVDELGLGGVYDGGVERRLPRL